MTYLVQQLLLVAVNVRNDRSDLGSNLASLIHQHRHGVLKNFGPQVVGRR
jgi:hypothetical protein